jgi:hypothetical protein
MKSITQIAHGIGNSTIEVLKRHGITSVEKLANLSVEKLIKIVDIETSDAKRYIKIAQQHLENAKTKEKIEVLIQERLTPKNQNQIEIINERTSMDNQNKKQISIDTLKKVAFSRAEEISKIKGIEISDAKRYIQIARRYLEKMRVEQREDNFKREIPIKKTLTSEEILVELKILSEKNRPNVQNLPKKPVISDLVLLKQDPKPTKTRLELSPLTVEKIFVKKPYFKSSTPKPTPSTENISSLIIKKEVPKKEIPREEIAKKEIPREQIIKKEIPREQIIKKEIPKKQLPKQELPKKEIPKKQLPKQELPKKEISKKKTFKKEIPKKGIPKREKPKKEIRKQPESNAFFPLETMQKIRFLHYKIKNLEYALQKKEDFSLSEINNVIEYIQILNINYKTESQIKTFKELDITPSFYDPIDKKEINIWDLIFECSHALWISALAYSYLSKQFESQGLMENAIVAMVECSKMYKTAAYFSAACTRQEEKGSTLSVDNLELNSEESRILAQNLAVISEEDKGNYSMAANLSAGLSALSKRLTFLKKYDDIKECQLKAQYNYDIGRACHLKAKSLLKISNPPEDDLIIKKLKQKANYYYLKAEKVWENMLKNIKTLSEKEKDNLRINLYIVNQNIIENDVVDIDNEQAKEIEDPEPLIIIPENLAPFIPRTTNFLTQYKQSELNFDAYQRYKNLISKVTVNFNKADELRNNKAGIGRTIKQLNILYENNDIDINTFTELLEKYNIKLEAIENAIQNLSNPNINT